MDLQELFRLGMKRDLPPLLDSLEAAPVLNLGAGNSLMPAPVRNLDRPDWDAEVDPIPYGDCTVGGIFAFHFLEHLRDPRGILRECERVLIPGAPLTIVVPHAQSECALQDFDHKSWFVLDSWRNLFNKTYQTHQRDWLFRIHLNLMMAITERNTAIFTQLVRLHDS